MVEAAPNGSAMASPDPGSDGDLEPWQEDPAVQLPSVIEPGRLDLRLWSTPPWGDESAECEVSLDWDGNYCVEWSAVSGVGLSVMSDVSFHGVAGWPDGQNIVLNYTRDTGEKGTEWLSAVAPTNGKPDGATDPRQWVQLATALVDLTDRLLDSGGESYDEFDDEGYYDPARDEWVDFDEMFRVYLASAGGGGTPPDFEDWFTAELAAGRYTLDESGS